MELQALAKVVHLIKHFSWVEVMDSAIAGGLSASFPSPAPNPAAGAAGGAASGATAGAAIGGATGSATSTSGLTSFFMTSSQVTLEGVAAAATETAVTNIATQLANMAVGVQKKFDVKSVFDSLLMSVFDSAVQHYVPLPSNTGLGRQVERAMIKLVENMSEQYVAQSIVGGPRQLEDLFANALGTAVGSVLSDRMHPDSNPQTDASHQKSKSQPQYQLKSQGHEDQHIINKADGVGKQYGEGSLMGHGEPGVHTGLPQEPGAWQEHSGTNILDNSSNRPAMSVNQVHSQHYTTADNYHQVMDEVNKVLNYVHQLENEVDHLTYTAAANQHQAAPLTTAHAVHGGIQSSRVGSVNDSWVDKFAHVLYKHQDSWWAKATIGASSAFNHAVGSSTGRAIMQTLQGAGEMADTMNPLATAAEYYTHHDLATGQYISPSEALSREAWGGVALVGGEIAGSVLPRGAELASPLLARGALAAGKWGASLWGRDDVAESVGEYTYNMVENPGPLSELPGNPAANFVGGKYNSFVLDDSMSFYRVGKSGGGRNSLGQWFTREPIKSELQGRLDLAVKRRWYDSSGNVIGESPLESSYKVRIPSGTTINEGPIGYQGGFFLGGQDRMQIFIEKPWDIEGLEAVSEKPLVR